jgi:tetratricopeptide (TPR) repeat protein
MTKLKNRFIFLIMLSHSCFFSQVDDSRNLMKRAQVSFDAGDYFGAYKVYRQVLSSDKKNEKAAVNAAACVFKMNYVADSALFLQSSLSSSSLPDAKYYLARIHHQQKRFDDAMSIIEAYKKINVHQRSYSNDDADYILSACVNAKKFIAMPKKSLIRNVGEAVNSRWNDEEPLIVTDESALYFTSKREGSSKNLKDAFGNFREDIYVSYRKDGKWQKAENLGEPVNTDGNDACVSLSADGQKMIIYRSAADYGSGDLYTTKTGNDNKWETPEKIGKEVNSQFIETNACFSRDTNEIYFSSNRPGGYGGKDIYRVKKLPNGNWAMPFNLGPNVNTLYDEDAPFLHPDGVTLYFSSKGHDTMGEFDVFKSISDANGYFSKAENLGHPINDVGNDIYFVLNADGQKGYYSSVKSETYGGSDIYEIDTRFSDNELRVRSGFTSLDGITGKAKVTLIDAETKQVNGIYNSNPVTGKFILLVNPFKKYKVIVQHEGYRTFTTELEAMVQEEQSRSIEYNLKKE